jgi:murein DD-endopeptidase MepM/ murein hydrolase activator NlpD
MGSSGRDSLISWILRVLALVLLGLALAAEAHVGAAEPTATPRRPTARPTATVRPSATARPTATLSRRARRRSRTATVLATLRAGTPTPEPTLPPDAAPPPLLALPIPPGETWEVIQGYNCGTHDGWGRMSLDLVNHEGRTRDAPVYASADGSFWYWGEESGTMILGHGDGYYTMYTHMQRHVEFARGATVARGTEIGRVGSVAADHTVPHLHFTFYYVAGYGTEGRVPLPLRFVDGYDLPDQGLCNNHRGTLLTATMRKVSPRLYISGLQGYYAERYLGR